MAKSKISKQKYGLIAAVKTQNSLYDPKSANLKSNREVWNQVAAQCGLKSGQIAKLMWKKLREAYIANQKKPTKNINKNYCIYFKHMKFLDPFLINKKKEDNSPASECKVNTEIEVETNENIQDDEPLNLNETTTNHEFTTIQYWNDNKDDLENITELETNSVLKPTDESCSEFNSGSDIESYEDIILPDALDNGTADKSLKMFFDAMFAATSQFPQVIQRTVKKKIFSAILEAEEEAEKLKNSVIGTNSVQVKDEPSKI